LRVLRHAEVGVATGVEVAFSQPGVAARKHVLQTGVRVGARTQGGARAHKVATVAGVVGMEMIAHDAQ
jgi:hypothetical protein